MSQPGGMEPSEFGGGDLAYNMQQPGGVRIGIDDVRAVYQTNPDDPESLPDPARTRKDGLPD